MAKRKGKRVQVILACTEGTSSRYFTEKSKQNTPNRLELKKYNPILKRYTLHKEIK